MITYSKVMNAQLMDGLKTALGTARIRLFVNDITPDKTLTLAQFTEATFAGYAASPTATMTGPVNDIGDKKKLVITPAVFIAGDDSPGDNQTAFGYYATFGTDTVSFIAERFAPPIGMNVPGNIIVVMPEIVSGLLTGQAVLET